MRKYILFLTFTILSSCSKKKETLFPFQNADKIEYYRIIPGKEMVAEDKKLEIIVYSSNLKDHAFELEKTLISNYNKVVVPNQLSDELIKFFPIPENRYQKASFSLAVCAPVYRDILVFKKSDKIIGYAKICFSCSQNFIITESKSAVDIDLDYSILKQILNQVASS